MQRISSAANEKVDHGKTNKIEKRASYGTREEWVTDKKNEEEEEAMEFEIEYGTRHKNQQKQGTSNRMMKVIQLEDEPLLPPPCRIKKVIELREGIPTITMSITEESQRQDVKQKKPLNNYPLRHRKADAKTANCKG